MPQYTFKCLKCSRCYTELAEWDETNKYKGVKCPHCKSKKKERTFDYNVNCTFGNPKESSKWDNFGYRAGYNMEGAKNDRRKAAAKSHMGIDPYPNMS
jgi:DNA-directed RNA polymerase subunit RPC12/RpoP